MKKKLRLKLIFKVMVTYEDDSEECLEEFSNYEAAETYILNDMPYWGAEFWIKKCWVSETK